jgi:hypothetical protein
MLFSPFTFRNTGQPSDPETSPLIPAHYAGDTTLRLVAQLQPAAAASSAATAAAPPDIAGARAGSWPDPQSTDIGRAPQRVRGSGLKPLVRRHSRVLAPDSHARRSSIDGASCLRLARTVGGWEQVENGGVEAGVGPLSQSPSGSLARCWLSTPKCRPEGRARPRSDAAAGPSWPAATASDSAIWWLAIADGSADGALRSGLALWLGRSGRARLADRPLRPTGPCSPARPCSPCSSRDPARRTDPAVARTRVR